MMYGSHAGVWLRARAEMMALILDHWGIKHGGACKKGVENYDGTKIRQNGGSKCFYYGSDH